MKKAFYIISAALGVALAASCEKEQAPQDIIPTPETDKTTYTLSVKAAKSVGTKALDYNLNATWGANDEVKVCLDGSATPVGALTPKTPGSAETVLEGTIDLTGISAGDKLDLIFPSSDWSYEGQDGTLEKLASDYDFARAEITVAEVNGTSLVASDASFTNEQSLVKFTILDKSTNSLLDIKSLTISAASGKLVKSYAVADDAYTPVYGDIVVTPSSVASEFYVALRNNSGAADTYTLTAIDNNGHNYTYIKNEVTFANGNYKAVNVKMSKETDVYTVAGSPIEVFGSSWNQNDSANDMVKQADGTYRKTYQLTGTEIGLAFKVIKNREWSNAWPSGNYTINDNDVTKGTLVITFDPSSEEVNAYIDSDAYTIAGDDQSLFGASWVPSETVNDMVKQDDGTFLKNYTIPSTLVGIKIQFKVVKDHKWDESWGKDGGSDNYSYEIPHTGTLHISFDPTSHDIDAWMDDIRYSIAGTFNVWNISANPMIKQANGTYKSEVSVPAGYPTIEYKVVQGENEWIGDPNNGNNNYSFNLGGDGATTLFFTYDPASNNLTVEEQQVKLYFKALTTVENELCFDCNEMGMASWPGTPFNTANQEIIAGSRYYYMEFPASMIWGHTYSGMYLVDRDNWTTVASTLTFPEGEFEYFIVGAKSESLELLSGRPAEPSIAIDGTFSDWDGIVGESKVSGSGNTTVMKAYSNGTDLFVYLKLTPVSGDPYDLSSGRYFRLYFDKDNDSTGEYTEWYRKGADAIPAGIDNFLVYFNHSGDVSKADIQGIGSDYSLKVMDNSSASLEVELKVPLTVLGDITGDVINIFSLGYKGGTYSEFYGGVSGIIIP